MKRKIKASLTVEASFVVSITIVSIGIILSLWIFKFQECWYTQVANECLLTGSNLAVLEEDGYMNLTKSKWESVREENYLKPKNLATQITKKKDGFICIMVNGSTSIWGMEPLKLRIEQEIGIIKPVKTIRIIQAAKEVIKDESGVPK